jgi:hypothetical protein
MTHSLEQYLHWSVPVLAMIGIVAAVILFMYVLHLACDELESWWRK